MREKNKKIELTNNRPKAIDLLLKDIKKSFIPLSSIRMVNTMTEPLLVTNNSKIWYEYYLSSCNLIILKISGERKLSKKTAQNCPIYKHHILYRI